MNGGWFRESHRHSLAARGIKTKRYLSKRTPVEKLVPYVWRDESKEEIGTPEVKSFSQWQYVVPSAKDVVHKEGDVVAIDEIGAARRRAAKNILREQGANQKLDRELETIKGRKLYFPSNTPFKEYVKFDEPQGNPPYYLRFISDQDRVEVVGPFETNDEANEFIGKFFDKSHKAIAEMNKGYEEDIDEEYEAELDEQYGVKGLSRLSEDKEIEQSFPGVHAIQKLGEDVIDEWSPPPIVSPDIVLAQEDPQHSLFGSDPVEEFVDDKRVSFGGTQPLSEKYGKAKTAEIDDVLIPNKKKFVRLSGLRWMGGVDKKDSYGVPITDDFIDGVTKSGQWAIMTPESYRLHGAGLGWGRGQRYKKINDKWEQVEGGRKSQYWE